MPGRYFVFFLDDMPSNGLLGEKFHVCGIPSREPKSPAKRGKPNALADRFFIAPNRLSKIQRLLRFDLGKWHDESKTRLLIV